VSVSGVDDELERARLDSLTNAEQVVLREAMGGDSVKAIAHRLSLSPATVRSHLSAIYGKLNVDSRAHLIAAYGRESNTGQPREHDRTRRKSWRRMAVVGVGAFAMVATLAALANAAFGPQEVSQRELASLAERGEVSALWQRDNTLIASTEAGEVSVPNMSIGESNRFAQAHSIDFTIAPYEPSWLEVPLLLVPVIAFALATVAIVWLALRHFRFGDRMHV
jgi:DNA-binding CsgD family transcriptional regulator